MIIRHLTVLLVFFLVVVLGSLYNPYHYFYGFVEIVDLEKREDEYIVEISGDFGSRVGIFTSKDTIDIQKDKQIREDKISAVWPQLSKGESYQMLVEIHRRKGPFQIERINFDYNS